MKNILLIYLITLLYLVSSPCWSQRFGIPEAGIVFNAPDGFTQLSAGEIALKYPSNRAPAFVVGNKKRTTTIAYDLKPDKLSVERIPEIKASFEQIFERIIPGIEWKKREIIEFQNKKWIYFEMTSHAIDTDIYNIMLITFLKEKMLVLNFNSTTREFPKIEASLRKSIQSIEFTEEGM